MIFIITYLVIGLILMMMLVREGNIIEELKDRGLISDISGMIGCIVGGELVIISWPYFAYLIIKEFISNY